MIYVELNQIYNTTFKLFCIIHLTSVDFVRKAMEPICKPLAELLEEP